MDHFILTFLLCLSGQGKNSVKWILHNGAVQAQPFQNLYNRTDRQNKASFAQDNQALVSSKSWKQYWFLPTNAIQLKQTKSLDYFLRAKTVLNSAWDIQEKEKLCPLQIYYNDKNVKCICNVTAPNNRMERDMAHGKTAWGSQMCE